VPDFPITVRDSYGNELDITAEGGVVYLDTVRGDPPLFAFGNDERREALAQAWIAACHKADDQARPVPCGALAEPRPGNNGAWACNQTGAHGEHIARGPGGVILASWAVSDG
jgi:hypothetical protein